MGSSSKLEQISHSYRLLLQFFQSRRYQGYWRTIEAQSYSHGNSLDGKLCAR